MKLRTKYLLFVVILHAIALALSYYVFQRDKVFFLVAEVVIIVSIVIAYNLYRQLIQPLKSLMTGLDAMKDQDFNVKFLPTGKHEVDQLIDVYNQMMDRLREERTMQEQQHFFLEKLIQTSPTGIVILDYDGQIQQVNPKALEIIGVDEKQLVNHDAGAVGNDLLKHIAALSSGETKTVKYNGASTYKLQKSHFVDRGFSRHFVMIEELTAELLAAEKNVYGKVIRMMAHEVNNTIGPVNSIIESALSAPDLWQASQDTTLKNALQVAADRNQNLNIFMRNFADLVKLPSPVKRQTDLVKLTDGVVKLMQVKANERTVELEFIQPEEQMFIMADEQLMEQVLINIIKNAIEAVDNSGRVEVKIDAKTKQLMIIDTGKGITDEQQEQIFSPFYSTKKDGQGIGLTLVREILTSHGFAFSLKTVGTANTVFAIQMA